MPSIALISDIHGNRAALEAVLEDVAQRVVETTYCLGDLVGYGPDPNGVIDLVRDRDVPSLTGNYDDGVGWDRGECGCYYPTEEAKRIGEASYAFTARTVTPERLAYLRGLSPEAHLWLGATSVHLVHGSPRKINEYLLRDRDERTFLRLAEAESDDVLAFGHTHEQWHRLIGGVVFVAVGSVGRPRDGDARAMYTVLRAPDAGTSGAADVAARADAGTSAEAMGSVPPGIEVEHVRVSYDAEVTARAVEDAGLPQALADQFRRGG